MLVYWGILLWVFVIGYFQPSMSNPIEVNGAIEYRAKWGFAILLFGTVIFFAAFRTRCIDTESYISDFNNAPVDMSMLDQYLERKRDSQLFYGLQVVFKCYISQDSTMWMSLIAILQGMLIAKTLRKYSPDVAMGAYIFIASTLAFSWMYNGIRQFIAVTILFACTEWILKNRWYLYLPVALFLCGLDPIYNMFGAETPFWFLGGIHQSSMIMIPIFILAQGKAWNKKVILLAVLLLLMVLSGTLDSAMESATSTTTYADDIANAAADSGSSPGRTVVALAPVIMAFFKRKEIAEGETPPIIHLCINMSIITAVLYMVSMVTSGIYVGRLPIYCELYNLILIPWLIVHPYKKDQTLLTQAIYFCYLLFFIYQMYFSWSGLTYCSTTLGIELIGGTG